MAGTLHLHGWGPGLILGWGTKIPQAAWCGQKKGKMRTGSANEHTGTIWQRLYISLKKIPILEQKGINRNLFVTDRI